MPWTAEAPSGMRMPGSSSHVRTECGAGYASGAEEGDGDGVNMATHAVTMRADVGSGPVVSRSNAQTGRSDQVLMWGHSRGWMGRIALRGIEHQFPPPCPGAPTSPVGAADTAVRMRRRCADGAVQAGTARVGVQCGWGCSAGGGAARVNTAWAGGADPAMAG